MVQLDLRAYIRYLRAERGISEITAENYEDACKYLGIHSVDTSKLTDLWAHLANLLDEDTRNKQHNMSKAKNEPRRRQYYGFVRQFYGLTRDLMNHHVIDIPKSAELKVLLEKLASKKHSPNPYTDEQLAKILRASFWVGGDQGLYRLLILLIYSGIRISAAERVQFSHIRPVDGVDGVCSFRVSGIGTKNHPYDAIIPKRAVEHMQLYNAHGSNYVKPHHGQLAKSSFSNYCRSRLGYAIISEGITEVTEGTSIFHSIRKTFISKLAESGVVSDNISLLLGEVPKSLAYKSYIKSPGFHSNNMTIRIAQAYAKSSLLTYEVWKERSGSPDAIMPTP